jgi:hypothetical protein
VDLLDATGRLEHGRVIALEVTGDPGQAVPGHAGSGHGHRAGVGDHAAAVGAQEDLGRCAECRCGRHDSVLDGAIRLERRRRR